jgi:hypothetical protein
MSRSFALLRRRSLQRVWLVALAAAMLGFFLVLAGAALAERGPMQ